MSTPLVGQPLDESEVELKKCQVLFELRKNPAQAMALKPIQDAVIGDDANQLVEFAVALTRLEESHEISIELLGSKMFIKLASTADEAQGSTSRLAVGAGVEVGQTSAPRILPDPLARLSIVKKSEEVHLNFCFTDCGRVASGKCECGNPVCSVHRYNAQGDREPNGGFCVMCSAVPQDRTEVYGSNGRRV